MTAKTDELEVLRVLVVCPHHPEQVLKAWRAYTLDAGAMARLEAKVGRPNVPLVVTESSDGESYAEVFPPTDWDGETARDIPIGLNGATLADVRDALRPAVGAARVLRGNHEEPRHLQVRWRCPKPSCGLDVSLTGKTRHRLRTEVVAGLWGAGLRGERRFTTTEMRL